MGGKVSDVIIVIIVLFEECNVVLYLLKYTPFKALQGEANV